MDESGLRYARGPAPLGDTRNICNRPQRNFDPQTSTVTMHVLETTGRVRVVTQ